MTDDCPFCRIAAGEAAAAIVHEDDRVIAFLDRHPAAPGHVLVVPNGHTTELFDLEESTTTAVFRTVRSIKTAIDDAFEPIGVSVFYTTGSLVGTIEHAHVHLVPRYEDDAVSISLPRDRLEAEEGDRIAARLRRAL